jgi:hypothetical protein
MHCRVAYMEAYMGNIHVEQAFSCIHAWVAYNWEQTWKMDAFMGSICWEHTSMGSIHGKHIWGAWMGSIHIEHACGLLRRICMHGCIYACIAWQTSNKELSDNIMNTRMTYIGQ